jgi:hypothetical protein
MEPVLPSARTMSMLNDSRELPPVASARRMLAVGTERGRGRTRARAEAARRIVQLVEQILHGLAGIDLDPDRHLGAIAAYTANVDGVSVGEAEAGAIELQARERRARGGDWPPASVRAPDETT